MAPAAKTALKSQKMCKASRPSEQQKNRALMNRNGRLFISGQDKRPKGDFGRHQLVRIVYHELFQAVRARLETFLPLN